MKTADFIKRYCVGACCPSFDHRYGCHEYDGEECDEAFYHPLWRGKSMCERVDEFCWARRDRKEKAKGRAK